MTVNTVQIIVNLLIRLYITLQLLVQIAFWPSILFQIQLHHSWRGINFEFGKEQAIVHENNLKLWEKNAWDYFVT